MSTHPVITACASKRSVLVVVAGLIFFVSISAWLTKNRGVGSQKVVETRVSLHLVDGMSDSVLKEAVLQFPEVSSRIRQEQAGQKSSQIEEKTYAVLSKKLGVDARKLREKLPDFANHLQHAPDARSYDRACAANVVKDYAEGEFFAILATDVAQGGDSMHGVDAMNALKLAAWSAENRIEASDLRDDVRDTEKLADEKREMEDWSHKDWKIANALQSNGQYPEAEKAYRVVLAEYEKTRNESDRSVLFVRNDIAVALRDQGKYAEAEAELRAVIAIKDKVLGPEDRDTFPSRMNLATALQSQRKYAEAEAEFRTLISIEEKVLGPDNPETLKSRNNLAVTLDVQGKHAEAEVELRTVLAIKEKVLAAENHDILVSRGALATALDQQGKHAEAEAEWRALLPIQEKILGPTHPDVFVSCFNLACCLKAQMKTAEALEFAKRAAEGERKTLGKDHPDTKRYEILLLELQAAR
jgi:tetratricopeptide (TPR) repeat protein